MLEMLGTCREVSEVQDWGNAGCIASYDTFYFLGLWVCWGPWSLLRVLKVMAGGIMRQGISNNGGT